MAFEPKKPNYRIKAQTKTGPKKSNTIGAAWVCENGNISIHLDPFITISESMNLQITMFPNDQK